MQRLFRIGGLLFIASALALPAFTSAQDKKTDDKKDSKYKDKLKVKADWKYLAEGKITAFEDKDEAGLQFTIRAKVPERNLEAEKGLAQAQQSLVQHQQQLLKAKNLTDRQNAANAINQDQVSIAKHTSNLIKYTDVDLLFKDKSDMRVRYYMMPPGIDSDTGESVVYTAAEKEKARGTEGYPGYKADRKVLKQDLHVVVFYLDKDLAEFDKAKKEDDKKTALDNSRFVTVMIYVPDPKYYVEPKK